MNWFDDLKKVDSELSDVFGEKKAKSKKYLKKNRKIKYTDIGGRHVATKEKPILAKQDVENLKQLGRAVDKGSKALVKWIKKDRVDELARKLETKEKELEKRKSDLKIIEEKKESIEKLESQIREMKAQAKDKKNKEVVKDE